MDMTRSIIFIALYVISFSSISATLCPDGHFHADGMCSMCADGSWTTAPRCAMTPNGSFQSDYGHGTRMTPIGNFIPDTGNMVMCPDGQFYAGNSCQLLPDGHFIGTQ